ncbi:hypothetical protein F0562_014452 [Nyssa sinensis]|uniref:C3H1-type domain-containing protein n=1 Tax=Nyssa sinensis TaxID=561372 RepID=A0A5J4ZR44_9ASTE|nr:hypothetical protein F0562_014452 [Nyssa sinensis]
MGIIERATEQSWIQNLDPENASKIIGRLLIQDHGDKEMIRLAFGPESLVHSVILKVRKELGLSSSTPSPPLTPSSPLPFLSNNNPISLSRQNSSCSLLSSRLPSPLNNGISNLLMGSSSASINSSASPFYGSGGTDLVDEFQLQDQLSFLNEGSPTPKIPDLFYPQPDLASSPRGNGDVLFSSYGGAALNWNSVPHRRSCSVSDTLLGTEDPAGGFGWKPCLYFARGYCKNGNSCRFFHGSSLTQSMVRPWLAHQASLR